MSSWSGMSFPLASIESTKKGEDWDEGEKYRLYKGYYKLIFRSHMSIYLWGIRIASTYVLPPYVSAVHLNFIQYGQGYLQLST